MPVKATYGAIVTDASLRLGLSDEPVRKRSLLRGKAVASAMADGEPPLGALARSRTVATETVPVGNGALNFDADRSIRPEVLSTLLTVATRPLAGSMSTEVV